MTTTRIQLALACVITVLLPNASAQSLYWTEYGDGVENFGRIAATELDPISKVVLPFATVNPTGIAVDFDSGKVYWLDYGDSSNTGGVNRANLNGTGAEQLVPSGTSSANGLALDVSGGKMYWGEQNPIRIMKANLDGTSVEVLYNHDSGPTIFSHPTGLALDVPNNRIYWTDHFNGQLLQANMDGTGPVDAVVEGIASPHGVAVFEGNLYWTEHFTALIKRRNISGGEIDTLVTLVSGVSGDRPLGIAIDPIQELMYWVENGSGQIQRANLDGSGTEFMISGLDNPHGVCVTAGWVPLVPAVSEWGMVTMALFLLVVGTVVVARRRRITT